MEALAVCLHHAFNMYMLLTFFTPFDLTWKASISCLLRHNKFHYRDKW